MKITESELNLAYLKVNEFKHENIDNLPELIEVDIERNPLTHASFFDEDSEFATPFKLLFKFDREMGRSGAYFLATENIEIIDDDNTN